MEKVYIWGIGKYYLWCRQYLKDIDILGYISSGEEDEYEGKKVYSHITSEMMWDADWLIIASIYANDIVRKLLETGFTEWEKILVLEPTPMTKMLGLCDDDISVIRRGFFNQFSAKYGSHDVGELVMPEPNYSIRDMISPEVDPVRKYTLSMICDEIQANGINGDVAEFGVFTGEFAKEINFVFGDRKLLLFDTFEGFPKREIEAAKRFSSNVEEFTDACKDTSIELVMSKMKYPNKVEIYKGIFPESTEKVGDKQKYAFVSIDVDFKENTLAGLKYFYPRLSKGGYMMVHDYNNRNETGNFGMMVKDAFKEYEIEIGHKLPKIPICDRGGLW